MAAILTATEMRSAEQASDVPEAELMERAGAAAAEAIRLFAGPMRTLILCGPGNNGGDGYVIARLLGRYGFDVAVAPLGQPRTDAAKAARARWTGPVSADPAPLLVDALFGTGLTRGLDPAAQQALAAPALIRVAIDLPSGIASDDGTILSPVPDQDMTIALGTLKPAHLLQPATRHMGRLVTADIGIEARSALRLVERPHLPAPGPDAHKYRRGYVSVMSGEMPGAAELAAHAALRSGAGYVRLAGARSARLPSAIVQGTLAQDDRVGAWVLGPGLGRSEEAASKLDLGLSFASPLVLDGDALWWLAERRLAVPPGTILTPHEGEFARLFAALPGSKVERARAAAAQTGAVILYKGADTVIAAPDGRAAIAPPAPSWLASAGTGDVLAGIAGAMRARGLEPFEAACAAAWLHARAAERAGPAPIADDLLAALPAALAHCA